MVNLVCNKSQVHPMTHSLGNNHKFFFYSYLLIFVYQLLQNQITFLQNQNNELMRHINLNQIQQQPTSVQPQTVLQPPTALEPPTVQQPLEALEVLIIDNDISM